MATLRIDSFDFHFSSAIEASKYDETWHYRKVIQPMGKRAVDITAIKFGGNPPTAWLVEAKDYRVLHGMPKDALPSEIVHDVVRKVVDTLEGLHHASSNALHSAEKLHANRMITARETRVIFHLEPYAGPATKLFPRDPSANVSQKLKQLLKNYGLTSQVLNAQNTPKAGVPWTVS